MSISITSGGFTLDGTDVRWVDVRAVVTYKHDMFAYDDICLAFKLADGSWVEASEDQPGFASVIEAIARQYPAVPRDWYQAVMFPAFRPNYRVLWGEE